MDKEKLIIAGIDYEEGADRFRQNIAIYEKFLRKFFDGDEMDRLYACLEQGDVQGAFGIAHDLKGNSGNLSINNYYKEICKLVDLLRSHETTIEEYMPVFLYAKEMYEIAKQAVSEN